MRKSTIACLLAVALCALTTLLNEVNALKRQSEDTAMDQDRDRDDKRRYQPQPHLQSETREKDKLFDPEEERFGDGNVSPRRNVGSKQSDAVRGRGESDRFQEEDINEENNNKPNRGVKVGHKNIATREGRDRVAPETPKKRVTIPAKRWKTKPSHHQTKTSDMSTITTEELTTTASDTSESTTMTTAEVPSAEELTTSA
ncbi:uncharacterized protein LOC131676445 [Topomyia yanbarensis]|uniref:uncharacterized protein LOC131676445 n=1 Tax=Topomyia yanbarensis TaxID=2498891 RepID=UPI00273B6D57|nr:uncharacterized protein LOC131676445 [Topomyia yanbarensis]